MNRILKFFIIAIPMSIFFSITTALFIPSQYQPFSAFLAGIWLFLLQRRIFK